MHIFTISIREPVEGNFYLFPLFIRCFFTSNQVQRLRFSFKAATSRLLFARFVLAVNFNRSSMTIKIVEEEGRGEQRKERLFYAAQFSNDREIEKFPQASCPTRVSWRRVIGVQETQELGRGLVFAEKRRESDFERERSRLTARQTPNKRGGKRIEIGLARSLVWL